MDSIQTCWNCKTHKLGQYFIHPLNIPRVPVLHYMIKRQREQENTFIMEDDEKEKEVAI